MSIERPEVDDAMIRVAAIEIAAKLDGADVDNIVSEYSHSMDGFDLAKALDKHQGWDTTREDMEVLDDMEGIVRSLHKKAEIKWFAANDIQPPLPIGTPVKMVSLDGDTAGVITGICEYSVAHYEVKMSRQDDSQGVSRRLICFEDAVEA